MTQARGGPTCRGRHDDDVGEDENRSQLNRGCELAAADNRARPACHAARSCEAPAPLQVIAVSAGSASADSADNANGDNASADSASGDNAADNGSANSEPR